MSVVTKTGDKGTTGLFGPRRVAKDDTRIEAYGTVDECNAVLGLILAAGELPPETRTQLLHIQHLLFRVGGDLATPLEIRSKQDRVTPAHAQEIEEWIAAIESALPPQTVFILPGGSEAAARLHLARTVCRRAERRTVTLTRKEEINPQVVILLNRLSDYFFVLARKVNAETGVGDVEVQY